MTTFDPPRRPTIAERSEGCFMSSLDLRAGLDMRVVAGHELPHEVWCELLRLQARWRTMSPHAATA